MLVGRDPRGPVAGERARPVPRDREHAQGRGDERVQIARAPRRAPPRRRADKLARRGARRPCQFGGGRGERPARARRKAEARRAARRLARMALRLQNRARMKRLLLAAALAAAVPARRGRGHRDRPHRQGRRSRQLQHGRDGELHQRRPVRGHRPAEPRVEHRRRERRAHGDGRSTSIYASNTAPPTTTSGTDVANFCPEADDTASSPQVHAGQLGTPGELDERHPGRRVLRVARRRRWRAPTARRTATSSTSARTCYDDATLEQEGLRERQVHRPGREAATRRPGSRPGRATRALYVSWTASGGSVDVDHYVAAATPTAGGATVLSSAATGEDATIEGLVNGTTYSVVVYALQRGREPEPRVDARGRRARRSRSTTSGSATARRRARGRTAAAGRAAPGRSRSSSVALLALLRRRS